LTIQLSEQDETIIREQIASGRDRDAAEAILKALGLLDKLDAEIAWLNSAIDPAEAHFDQGLGFEMTASRLQDLVDRGIQRARKRRPASNAAAS
jgi:Arc/MetJ-type ribon-helix-helix transcriptional regulator